MVGRDDGERPTKRARKEGRDGRRKRVVLFLGFIGEGYQGMQRNPGCKTIEGDLMDAVFKAGVVGDTDQKTFHLVNWTRSARTDKGVSAANQVLAFNVSQETGPELVDALNENLPESIRIHGLLVSTQNFSAKDHCNRRQYEYLIPANTLIAQLAEKEEKATLVDRFNLILRKFEGTHLFHNFTEGKPSTDPSCQRFVTSVKCDAELDIGGVQIIKVTVVGQSFLLHMIRKIVGLSILVLLGIAPEEIILLAFDKEQKLRFPMAPALGLLLDSCFFDMYNRKFDSRLAQSICPKQFAGQAEDFKRNKIYPNIVTRDQELGVMKSWIDQAKKSLDLDREQIMTDFRMLDRPEITREQKRKERIASCYPIAESFRGFYNFPAEGDLPVEGEQRKSEIVRIRDTFVSQFSTDPLLYCRVPGVVLLFGSQFGELDLPSMGLAINQDTLLAMTRDTPGAKDQGGNVVFVNSSDLTKLSSSHHKVGGARLSSGSMDTWTKWVSWGWMGPIQSDSVDGRAKLSGARCVVSSEVGETLGGPGAFGAAAGLAVSRTNRWRLPKMELAATVEKMLQKNGLAGRSGDIAVAMTAERGCVAKSALNPQPTSSVTTWLPEVCIVEVDMNLPSGLNDWKQRIGEARLATGIFAKEHGAKAWKTVSAGRLTRFFNKTLQEILGMVDVGTELSLEDASQLLGESVEGLCKFAGLEIEENKAKKYGFGKRIKYVVEECLRMERLEFELKEGGGDAGIRIGNLLSEGHTAGNDEFEMETPEVDSVIEWTKSQMGVLGSRGMVWVPDWCPILCLVERGRLDIFVDECKKKYGDRCGFLAREVSLQQGASTWHVQQNQELLC